MTLSRTARSRMGAVSAALLAVGLTALLTTPAAAVGTTTSVLVPASEIGSSYAAPGQKTWLVEEWGGGSHRIAADTFDSRSAVTMDRSATGSVVNVFRSFGAGVRPTSLASVLSGAGYSYTGDAVNMQFAMFYTPADPAAYGPSGTTAACRQANDGGVALPGKCFAILKFEPGASATGSYLSYTIDGVQRPFGGAGVAGWWATQQVGPYNASNRTGTLDQMLAQMADYEIYAIGASVGSGSPAGSSALLQLTFGGTRYSFGTPPVPAAPAPAPAADSSTLDQLIAAEGIDVDADTAAFTPSGSTDLTKVDPSVPFGGTFGWSDPTDAFVDVYAYSSPVLLGSFPVVDGAVSLAGVDLSGLTPGAHRLVFVGQTSGSLAVVRFGVAAVLAASGVEGTGTALLVAAPLVALGLALLVRSRATTGARRVRG